MTKISNVLVSSFIMMILITACIGTASATVNIWGADSTAASDHTNAEAYNQQAAIGSAQWYYDSDKKILWTEEGLNVELPIYLNVTAGDGTSIFGYNLTLEGDGVTPIAAKGTYNVAYVIRDAKISASVSAGNASAITSAKPENVANASFTAGAPGNYAIKLTNVKVATSAVDLETVSSLSEITGASVANIGKVIAFKVETKDTVKPEILNITFANVAYRTLDAPDFGTIYYFQERDSANDGVSNKLNAIIKNKDSNGVADNFDWTIVSQTGPLTLGINQANPTDNFSTVTLGGTNGVGQFTNATINASIHKTSDVANIFYINATYWNQSVVLTNATTVGTNVTFTYNVAAVPASYVIGATNNWDTFVELLPVGTAGYQNYTIYTAGQSADYTVTNSTTANDGDKKNLTVTASTKTGNEGPIAITLQSGMNGDPNEDNVVDIVDGAGVGIESIREAQTPAATILATAQQKFLADVNKDGIVNVADVLDIHTYIVDTM